MSLNAANRYDWEDVYHQAVALREQSPWEIITGEILFKVESSYFDEPGWCMVMGGAGEVYGLLVYLGEQGYKNYHDLQTAGRMQAPNFENYTCFFNQRLLHIEFVSPNELEKADKALHKAFKVPMSGEYRGIKIRHHLPGAFPDTIPDEMLPFLADCLEQATEVAKAAHKDDTILWGPDEETDQNLVRASVENKDGDVDWQTRYTDLHGPTWKLVLDQTALVATIETELSGLEKSDNTLLYHLQYTLNGVKEGKGMKPYRPLVGTFLNMRSGFANKPELYRYETLSKVFAKRLCGQLQELGYIPRRIIANTMFACELLEPIVKVLDIELSYDPHRNEFQDFAVGMESMRP